MHPAKIGKASGYMEQWQHFYIGICQWFDCLISLKHDDFMSLYSGCR